VKGEADALVSSVSSAAIQISAKIAAKHSRNNSILSACSFIWATMPEEMTPRKTAQREERRRST
jgi:hypothetical protein